MERKKMKWISPRAKCVRCGLLTEWGRDMPATKREGTYVHGLGQLCRDCRSEVPVCEVCKKIILEDHVCAESVPICGICEKPAMEDSEYLTPDGHHIKCALMTYSCLICGTTTPLPHVCPAFYPELR